MILVLQFRKNGIKGKAGKISCSLWLLWERLREINFATEKYDPRVIKYWRKMEDTVKFPLLEINSTVHQQSVVDAAQSK